MNGFIKNSFLIKLLHSSVIPLMNFQTDCNKCLPPGTDFVKVGKCATKSTNDYRLFFLQINQKLLF